MGGLCRRLYCEDIVGNSASLYLELISQNTFPVIDSCLTHASPQTFSETVFRLPSCPKIMCVW